MGFLDKPRSAWWRKLVFQLHLWTGLAIGIVVLLVGLTGSVIVFYHELYQWQEPKVTLEPGAPTLSVEQLLAGAQRRFPKVEFNRVYPPEHPDQAARVRGVMEGSKRWPYVYLHPQTGEMAGETVTNEPFLDWCYRLHMYLLAGDPGYTFNGICALLATGMCISGLILWWPGMKNWARGLKVSLRARWKRVNYDLHSAVGFWTALCLALVFLTGAYFRFPGPFVAAVEAVTGSSAERDPLIVEPRDTQPIPASEAVAIAEREIPNAQTTYVMVPAGPESPYYIGRKRDEDGLAYAANYVYIDPYTGEVLKKSVYGEGEPVARTVLRWFGFIHFGTFGGVTTQVLWIFLGLAPGVLFTTGALMYWNRALSKKWRRLSGEAGGEPVRGLAPAGGQGAAAQERYAPAGRAAGAARRG